MNMHMIEERRIDHGSDIRLRERVFKVTSLLKNTMKPESLGTLEEEKKWIQSRPSFREIEDLVDQKPREDVVDSEIRTCLKYLREVFSKCKDLISQIGEQIEKDNLKKLKALWSKVLDLGVSIDS